MLPTNPLLNATAPAGPHLPVALLRQYAAGALAPAAQHRVEAHTLACARCADVLAGLLQTPATTTDQALAQLQQRLRQRTQPAAPARLLPPRPRRHRWLAPQLAIAAALLLGLVASGWWVWLRRAAVPTSAPVASTATVPTPGTPPATAPPPAAAPTPASPPLAATVPPRPRQPRMGAAARARRPRTATAPVATSPPLAAAADIADEPAVPAATSTAPAATSGALARAASAPDSVALAALASKAASPASPEGAVRVRVGAMPAVPGLPPTPVGGYGPWREQLRREASEFKPEAPDRPLSGTVQLGVTIGPDGKIQEMRVLRGLRADYDAEAQRLVCEGPKWVPGIMGGQRAARTITVPVAFP